MRNARKKTSRTVAGILLLIGCLLLMATVIYTLNPLDSRDRIADAFGYKRADKSSGGTSTEIKEEANDPNSNQAKQDPASLVVNKRLEVKDLADKRMLSQAVSRSTFTSGVSLSGMNPVLIPAGQLFSYQDWMNESGLQVNDNAHSQLASVLLEAGLRAGMELGEHYPHLELPEYANPGFDASVSQKSKDLKLFNPHEFDLIWTLSIEDGKPLVRIVGQADADDEWAAPKVEVKQETFLPDQAVRIDFAKSSPKRGQSGTLVKVYVDGKLLYKDFYAPHEEELLLDPTPEEVNNLKHSGALQEEK